MQARTVAACSFTIAASAWTVATAATPPAGFEDRQLLDGTFANGASPAVGIAYEPGTGALFVIEQGDGTAKGTARVRRRDATTGVLTTALTLPCVDSVGERGLLGIAFDPDYLNPGGTDRYVYLYYTRAVGQTGQSCAISGLPWGGYNSVVRYRESGGMLTGEELLLRGPVLEANNHQGGAIRFGTDKTLFIAMGDNDTDEYPLPKARDLNDLRGKILRINRDGTIPANNPFVGQSGKRPEIWAWGLRNPFRTSVDPANGNLYIADVGEGRWEEIDAGIPGADYGWPCFEAWQTFASCTPTGDTKPIYAYDHGWGDSVIGGPVYRAGAFPADYDGAYFFGDYGGNWIRRARIAVDGTLTDVEMFMPDASSVVDMAVSPAGCLTWVSIGGLGVHNVCYVGGNNGQPQAVASAIPLSGLAPLSVQFDGSASSDPDQDPLTYAWTFGDSTTSSAVSPQHTYTTTGVRQATLTVNDGRGAANSSDSAPPLRIVVGNRSPSGTITTPPAGARYNAGATISYAGTATDAEDGTLPASAFSWTIVFHHGDHTHPFLGPIVGVSSGSFTIPANGEEATDVFYRIHMTVTDSGSPLGSAGKVSQTTTRDLLPNVATMTVAANPPGAGIQLSIDQIAAVAPWLKSSVVGFTRTLTAPSPQTIGSTTWSFVSWSDGGAATHTIAAPASDTVYTATYQCTAGCPTSPMLTATRVAPDSARLQWNSLPCATMYDVQRGSLGTLRSTAGNFTSATQACTANNMSGTTVTDGTPTPAGGQWFLVRGVGCGSAAGTFNENLPSQSGSRDAEIAAATGACP